MTNTETIRDDRDNSLGSQITNDTPAVTSPQIAAGCTAAGPDGEVREDAAKRNGIGWLMIVLVFFCMMIVPFAIGAIILFGR